MKKTIIITESDLNKIVRKKLTEQMESGNGFEKMVSHILFSQTQSHVFHLQTDKYSEHEALKDYYEDITDLFDSLIETYQGKNDIIYNYSSFPIKKYESNEKTIQYFEELISIIEDVYEEMSPEIQNVLDDILVLMRETIYKLKNLK
jgi:deoxyadenosine/deoxycytidine kinase